VATVEALPSADEREHLLDALAELIDDRGWQHFVTAPVVRPQAKYFPDPWSPDAAGVWRLARRFLRYADLPRLDASVELFDEGREPDLGYGHSTRHAGAAAWFAGIEDGLCHFGANVDQLDDPAGITAAMAHECSHAFRCAHDLMVEDLDVEEQLTDLTTVYLGFGILILNAAARHRSWNPGGQVTAGAYSFQSLGYLSPQALAFLLAAQLRVRGASIGAIRGDLETNQASYLARADAWLAKHAPDLAERLGVPEPTQWPDGPDLEDLLAPIDDEPDFDALPMEEDEVGLEVARMPQSRASNGTIAGALLGLLVVMGSSSLGGVWLAVGVGAAAALIVAGRKIGAAHPRWECSNCRMTVQRSMAQCPACRGAIVRELARPEDRLDDPPSVSYDS
jgi:hypothetical protein